MTGGLPLKDVWIDEMEVSSDKYPAFSKTGEYISQNYERLMENRLGYEARNKGTALVDYEKPEDFVDAMDSVRDDDFVKFLYLLSERDGATLTKDLINEVGAYMMSRGTVVVDYSDPVKAETEAKRVLGKSVDLYGMGALVDRGFGYGFSVEGDEVKDIIFINRNEVDMKNKETLLAGLAHEWGHREEVRGNTGAKGFRKKPEGIVSTEFVASLYGVQACMVIDKLGGESNRVQDGILVNLLTFDVVMDDSPHE